MIYRKSLTALSAAALLLAGCASLPRSHAGAVKPVTAATLGLMQGAAPTIASDWWSPLGDAQLDRIMADALAHNPSLDAALARLRQAQAGIAENKAGLLPQVAIDIDEERQRLSEKYIIPPPYGGSWQWVGTAQAGLNWTIDFAGRQKALIDQARSSADAAALDVAAARLALSGAVAQNYINLARADRQIAIARDFVASRQSSLSLAQSRKQYQLASDFDVRTAETLLAEAKQALVRAEGSRRLMIHALAALAGRGPDYYATIAAPTLKFDDALPLPQQIPADLLARRPDILAGRARIEGAEAGKRVARADFYPNVDLKAFVGSQALGLGALFTGGALAYGGGPAIHLPIFEGGRLKARYRGAEAQADAMIAGYNDTVLRAVKEAADALSAVETARADALQQHDIVAGLRDTVRLDAVRVRTGLGSQLDMLASGDRLLQAQQSETDIRADGALRRVQLLVALGGGFVQAEDPHQAASENAKNGKGQP